MGQLIREKIFIFVAYSFTFRYFFEQYLKILMVICIESLYVSGALEWETSEIHRNLSYPLKYKIAIGISAFLFLVLSFILLLAIIKGILNITKNKDNPNKVLVVTQGLNRRRLLFSWLYFFHFFFIRTFICVLVVLTPFVNSKILWWIVLIVQILFFLMHFVKLYDSWSVYLQGIAWETFILLIAGLLFSL